MKVSNMPGDNCRSGLIVLLLAVLTGSPALAQDDELLFVPNFRDTNIDQVIETVAEVTGRSIIVDQRARGFTVDFFTTEAMDADRLWEAFLQILQTNGYAAVESGGIWRIVSEAQIRQEVSPIVGGTGAEVVTRYVTVENIPPAQLVPNLRPMMPQSAQLTQVAGTNMLILADRADNMDRIISIIDAIDDANAQEVDVVPLQYAAAQDVAQKLTSVINAQQSGGLVGVQAFANERTNSVILTGLPSQLDRYRPIAEALDQPSTQGGGSRVRYLYYADAEELATNLQAQFGGTQVAESAETAVDPTGGDVNIWADVGTNSLVMRAPSVVLQDMLAIVDSLDIPRAQVHVQAIIVEMTDSRAAELGLTWAIDGAGGNQAATLTNFSGTVGGILQLAQIGAGGTPDPSLIADGVTAAVGNLSDSGTSWAAVLSALRGDAQTNVLQTPELVVLDNVEATINVGQEVPFLTGQYTNAGQGTGGAVNPFSTIQREPVGTTLTITPRINEGTGMRLTIEQVTSSISSSAVASDVITNERSIVTEVFVSDGDILVLGGLQDDQLRENEQRVPGLGRIPGLRWLFRARNTERSKSNLMVFIHPTILRDSLAASRISTDKYEYLRGEQRRRAEEPVPLLRDSERPELPPLAAPPSVDEIRGRVEPTPDE